MTVADGRKPAQILHITVSKSPGVRLGRHCQASCEPTVLPQGGPGLQAPGHVCNLETVPAVLTGGCYQHLGGTDQEGSSTPYGVKD